MSETKTTPLATRAERAGAEWSAQLSAGTAGYAEQLRELVASAFSAGWMIGYQAGVEDCSRIAEGQP